VKAEAEAAFNKYVDGLDVNRLEYEAVRRLKNDNVKVLRADGLEGRARNVGSFVNTLDGRIYKTGLSTSLADKVNGTLSFNADPWSARGAAATMRLTSGATRVRARSSQLKHFS
jgi:hypothetical protein